VYLSRYTHGSFVDISHLDKLFSYNWWLHKDVLYAVIVILLSACVLMLSYVIIVSCIDVHACIMSE